LQALVIFADINDGFRSKLLKPGFKHVFCILKGPNSWLLVDGAKGIPIIQSYAPLDFDIENHFKKEGMKIVPVEVGTSPSVSPFVLRNCVGMVKTVCAIKSFAVTPYQLYKHLMKETVVIKFLTGFARLPGGGILSSPKAPFLSAPPPPPPPSPEPAKKSAPEVTRARSEEKKRARSLAGDRSTLLTSPRGLLATDQANTGKSTLLGG